MKSKHKNITNAKFYAGVNADDNVYFDAKNDDNYESIGVDKLILKIKDSSVNRELTRKTAYIKQNTWEQICEVCSRTKNTKTEVINQILEYGLENLVIE